MNEDRGQNPGELSRRIEELSEQLAAERAKRERASTQVEHLFRISAAVLAARDLDEQLRLVADGIVTACNFRRCVITLLTDDWQVWKRSHAGLSTEDVERLEATPPISPEMRRRIFDERFRVGNSYFVPHDTDLASEFGTSGISSRRKLEEFVDWHPDDYLFVPLYGIDGKILGTISVDDPADGRRPTPESLRILELFAREGAFAIEQSLLVRELRRTEGYLENIVTSSRDAIVTTDPQGKVVIWNEGAERMLGWRKEEMIGESVVKVYGDEREAREIMRYIMSGEKDEPGRLEGHETHLKSKTGERIPVLLSAAALYGPGSEFLGTAGISRDLRLWKKLEEELLKAEKASTLREVAATLCHEINNFLEEILSAGQISLLTHDDPEIREMYGAAGKTAALDKDFERLTVISREALKIAALTTQLQRLALGGSYETTEYVGDIRMVAMPEERPRVTGRILVADDREYIREFLKDFLVIEGFEVDTAEDGQRAIEMAQAAHYDLVLSDIKMPHRNGYEVFAHVRQHDPGTKVILMTAYGYDPSHSIVKASGEGLSDVLYKPFEMARVRQAIMKALGENGGGGCGGGARD